VQSDSNDITGDTNQQVDVVETSTMLESPRSKDKRRLCKMIKFAFSDKNTGQPLIKTTAEFYRIGKMLGKGAFGRVNLAMHKITGRLVAVKSMNK
jgi:serine/threonine protein kinase